MNLSPTTHRTAISLFSGIGGLCEGVALAGFDVLSAAEWDKYAAENYRLNFPHIPLFEGDVADFFPTDEPDILAEHRKLYCPADRPSLLFGGPPCQGFSQIGPREIDDPRNVLYLQMCRIAEVLQPSLILIENVPNLLLMRGGLFKRKIREALIRIGYDNIGLVVLNAADFGVPQERKRVFFLAGRSDEISYPLQDALELAEQSLKRGRVSVWEAIRDLPSAVAADAGMTLPYPVVVNPSPFLKDMRLDYKGDVISKDEKTTHYDLRFEHAFLHNHHTKDIQEKRLRLIRLLRPGMKANSLPKDVWDNARPEKWRRFHPDKPAHTLMAQMHRDLSEWVHPYEDRWITVREAMRLQTFHDGIVLEGSEWQQLKQVGNAVPPLLGRIPALAAMFALNDAEGLPAPFAKSGQLPLFEQLVRSVG